MLYLVKGKVFKSEYGSDFDATEETEEIRLVEANSADEAEFKFENYFVSQSQDYDVFYHVGCVYAYELIK